MDIRTWYNTIADIYDELYGEEQRKKIEKLKEIYKKIFGNLKFKSGLDFGCGTGISTEFLLEICDEVYAYDISEKMIEIAKRKLKNVKFLSYNEIKKRKFDVILSVTVLQDNKNPEEILKLFKEVAKKLVIITVLKRNNINWKDMIGKYFKIIVEDEEEKDYIFFCQTASSSS